MFKVGDKVVCVNADDSGCTLILGRTYTVAFVEECEYEDMILVEEAEEYYWMTSRFKLKSEIMDNTDPTVEILQSEYDSLIEEINLLQELLAEQNAKLVSVEEFKPLTEMAYGDWCDIWDEDNPPQFLTSTGEIWTAEYLFKDAEYEYTVAFHQDDSTYSPEGVRLMDDGVDVSIVKRVK